MVISKLVSHEWDYIVLQEQSLLSCTDKDKFLSSLKKLCGIISGTQAKTVLFQTWAYGEGSGHLTPLLNGDDQYHPSPSDSYLAVCVIFKAITEKTSIGLPSPSNVSLYNLSVIQKISDKLV